MSALALDLHSFHQSQQASFGEVNGMEVVMDYGDAAREYQWIKDTVGLLDLEFRSRICLMGKDRGRFLHGQVTNEIQKLKPGQGCHAALVSAKGKMEGDLHVFCLDEEFLLDFDPGYTRQVVERLDRYIIADDVEITDVRPHYGLLSLQGPRASQAWGHLQWGVDVPEEPWSHVSASHPEWGEVYAMRVPRGPGPKAGLDLFIPKESLAAATSSIHEAVTREEGGLSGWHALEIHRIESGRPRFGQDMDEAHLAPETGMEEEVIRYDKGCYIGQEVIARIRTYGRVNKRLRKFRISGNWPELPAAGTLVLEKGGGKEAGHLTSVARSPSSKEILALGYLRKEFDEEGRSLVVRDVNGETGEASVGTLPFQSDA